MFDDMSPAAKIFMVGLMLGMVTGTFYGVCLAIGKDFRVSRP
jgi:hypothetical protein